MEPLIFSPAPFPPLRGGRGQPKLRAQPKLVSLPQTFVVWSFDAEREKKNLNKSVRCILRLESCLAMTGDEMNGVAVSSQIRIWQDHNRYSELKGKYVRFVFSDFDKATIELPLDKHHVVGG